jgi:hypothetical protein
MTKKWTLLIAVLALVAAACGGSGSDDGEGVASLTDANSALDDAAAAAEEIPDPVDAEQALLAFTQCLRDEGLDIADPTVDSDGNPRLSRPDFGEDGPPEGFRESAEACQELLEGVTLGRQQRDLTEFQDTFLEFASCMRDNGYDMPDPDFSNFGQPGQGQGQGGGGPFGQIDREDPDFVAASEACGDILGGIGRGGFGGRPGGGGG